MAKILVIDDERSLADAIYLSLKTEGYKAYKAVSREEGFHLLQKIQPDIVLCDLVLDQGSGLDIFTSLSAPSCTPRYHYDDGSGDRKYGQ